MGVPLGKSDSEALGDSVDVLEVLEYTAATVLVT